MWVIKYITLALIFGGTSFIGILIAKKYSNRLKELQEIKKALHMLEVKMKFTYMSIPVIFREIETQVYGNIAKIFGNCAEKIEYMPAEKAWNESIYNSNTNLLPKDKEVLNGLGKLLGQTDIEGQINQIKLVDDFLNIQIQEANEAKNKNEKLYRTLRNGCRTWYCYYINLKNK
ncbi:MAG TPA: stage III sporulation protein AB [Clostridiaceae bacterium]|nr:stage III sporulation protein AB [Clostridiaceae bacterium]